MTGIGNAPCWAHPTTEVSPNATTITPLLAGPYHSLRGLAATVAAALAGPRLTHNRPGETLCQKMGKFDVVGGSFAVMGA